MVINIFSLSLLSLSLSLSIGHWLWHPCSLTHYLIMFMLSIMFKNYLKSQFLTKVLPIFSLIISKSCLTETEMLQFWRNFVIICPGSCQIDNCRCKQCRKFRQNDTSVPVFCSVFSPVSRRTTLPLGSLWAPWSVVSATAARHSETNINLIPEVGVTTPISSCPV